MASEGGGSAVGILAELHWAALQMVCGATGQAAQGLTMAAIRARREQRISNRIYKKLMHLDIATAWARHASAQKANSVLAELRVAFEKDEHTEEGEVGHKEVDDCKETGASSVKETTVGGPTGNGEDMNMQDTAQSDLDQVPRQSSRSRSRSSRPRSRSPRGTMDNEASAAALTKKQDIG